MQYIVLIQLNMKTRVVDHKAKGKNGKKGTKIKCYHIRFNCKICYGQLCVGSEFLTMFCVYEKYLMCMQFQNLFKK